MYRQNLLKLARSSVPGHRTFVVSATLHKLPSVEQPHTLDKPGKDDHNPQTENMKKSRKEKEATSQEPKENKPEKGPNAGIGMQDERGSTKGSE